MYFKKVGWPEKTPKDDAERKVFIAVLHKQKTEFFMVLIEKKLLSLSSSLCCKVWLSNHFICL